MYTIKTLNNISDVIYNELDKASYTVSDDADTYEGVLVRSADMKEMTMPDSLLAIARAGAGVNNIPLDKCSEQGIVVFNTPGANANAVKELVLCGLLLAGRDVRGGMDWAEKQHADGVTGIDKLAEKAKKQFVGHELAGKKLGVIGLGAIGVLVANAASQGLNMNVIGYDPFLSVDAAMHMSRSIKRTKSLSEIFTECDYITIHVPLSDKTRNMIGKNEIASMKKGSVILNFARNGLVDNEAVLAALEDGQLRRYVVDFPSDDMVGKKGVITIPHLGASTPESEDNCAEMAAAELKSYLEDGNVINSVNFPRCEMPKSGKTRLAIINRNITNMVGQITGVLAATGVNIANMVNNSRGDWAYTIIDTDSDVENDSVEKIKAIDGVVRVRVIK